MVTFAQGGEATAAVDMVASIPVNIKKELRFSCLLKPYLVLLDAAVQKGRKTWETLVENASVTQDLPPAWRLKVMEIDERSPFSRHDGSLVGEYILLAYVSAFLKGSIGQSILIPTFGMTPGERCYLETQHMMFGRRPMVMSVQNILIRMLSADYFKKLRN